MKKSGELVSYCNGPGGRWGVPARRAEWRWKAAGDSKCVLKAELFLAVGRGVEGGLRGYGQLSCMSH